MIWRRPWLKAGRGDESAANLAEAEKIQQTLKNEPFLASLLNTRGDVSFFRGDVKSADKSYRSALQLISHSRENEVTLLSKLNVARVAVAEGRFQEAMRSLQTLLNPKGGTSANLSLQIQLAMAQAAIGMRDYARADYILEQQLATAKRSGVRFDLARIYYLLGTSARLNGSGDRAADYYREAAQLLEVIRSDSGDGILRRTDFKTMYDESKPSKKCSLRPEQKLQKWSVCYRYARITFRKNCCLGVNSKKTRGKSFDARRARVQPCHKELCRTEALSVPEGLSSLRRCMTNLPCIRRSFFFKRVFRPTHFKKRISAAKAVISHCSCGTAKPVPFVRPFSAACLAPGLFWLFRKRALHQGLKPKSFFIRNGPTKVLPDTKQKGPASRRCRPPSNHYFVTSVLQWTGGPPTFLQGLRC